MDTLAPDAVLIADGGGVVEAVRVPVVGAKKIVNLLGGFARFAPTAVSSRCWSTARRGLRILLDGVVDTVIGFAFEDGRISRRLRRAQPGQAAPHRRGDDTAPMTARRRHCADDGAETTLRR